MTRVAIMHDFLAGRGGGERVALALAQAWPDAPVHTLIYEPSLTFDEFRNFDLRPSGLNRSAFLRQNFRASLPAAAVVALATKIDADVTICSTSGFGHLVRTTGKKLVYCHTPARWLHAADYRDRFSTPVRLAAKGLAIMVRPVDAVAMKQADRVLVNSAEIARDVRRLWDLDSLVIPPGSQLDLTGAVIPVPGIEPGFVLSPTRALGYKRLDVLAAAARRLPNHRFIQIGEGPELERLRRVAPPNLRLLGRVSDAELRWAYRNARLVALTCPEDFGLVPQEAAAHGLTTVAPAARGLLEHVGPSTHGVLYPLGDHEGLARVIASEPAPQARGIYPERLRIKEFVADIRSEVAALR